jgi:D-alanyl-D-alanine carboxypeptidase
MSSPRVHLGWLAACVAFVSGLASAADAQSPTAVSPEIARKLNEIVAHAALDGSRPGGMIVRVHSLKDNRIWEGAAGAFDGATEVPIKPTDPFRTASIAKSFAAGVIWRLVEEHKLGLDDLIGKYLDPSLVSRIHVLNGVSYGERITIRQLLCHCSGVYDFAAANGAWERYVFMHPEKVWDRQEYFEYAIRYGKPYFVPGEGQHYSDTGYELLGLVIEKVTGKPLAKVYHEFILDPLGLKETYQEGREPAVGRPRSHNYIGFLDETPYDPTQDGPASGGFVSTAQDLARYITAVLQGRFFKDPRTLAAALEVAQVPDPEKEDHKSEARFLFRLKEVDGVEFLGHGGFWGSEMQYQPQRQLIITGASNQVERKIPLAALAKAFDISIAESVKQIEAK